MALSDDKITEIRDADHTNLKTFLTDAETLRAQAIDKIEQEHNVLVEKIRVLMDEKGDILRSPMSKAELLEYAKDELKKRRAEALSIISTHLESCLKGHSAPFSELSMKSLFAEDKAFRLLWLILSEKDIKTIVDGLDEIGIPATERDAKVTDIDSQINEIMLKINNG